MPTDIDNFGTAPAPPTHSPSPGIVSVSIPDPLAALRVRPDTGLSAGEVGVRRNESGYSSLARDLSCVGDFAG